MAKGGRRPGAGRKKDPDADEFRRYWRQRLNSPQWRRHLEGRLKKSDSLLAAFLNKIEPSPVSVSGDGDGSPVVVRIVSDDRLGVRP